MKMDRDKLSSYELNELLNCVFLKRSLYINSKSDEEKKTLIELDELKIKLRKMLRETTNE